MLIGIDTGGTFTDLIAFTADGRVWKHKLLSTPDDPAQAFVTGLDHVLSMIASKSAETGTMPSMKNDGSMDRSSPMPPNNTFVVHGSTVATNAVLERKGARTAWVTTAGFKDLLHIGRQTRSRLYELNPQPAAPLIPRDRCFELSERVDATGQVITALSESELARLIPLLKAADVESVALLFLHSYHMPEHERAAADYLNKAGIPVFASHDVVPEHREYERGATTAVNAYVSPVIGRYLKELEPRLRTRGFAGLRIMQSSGGSTDAAEAARLGVHTILSGPAGGVVGAQQAAAAVGEDHIITFDMGGTSTDVSVLPGEILTTRESSIEGYPLRIPIVDIHTVGAGGGSIAYVDPGGALKVGPQSAGAAPGPACYGRGGTDFTVTDADVVLGRLPTSSLLGGSIRLDRQAALDAGQRLADRLGATVEETAHAVSHVAAAAMERAIKAISVAKGYDPRDFSLVAFGGAGPLHASQLAENLSIRRVIVPPTAGILSAFGVATADVVKTYSQGMIARLDEATVQALRTEARRLIQKADEALDREGIAAERRTASVTVDMRYARQSHELTVAGGDLTAASLASRFHQEHTTQYGYARQDESIEVTAVNVRMEGRSTSPPPSALARQAAPPAPFDTVTAHFPTHSDRPVRTPVFDRTRLGAGSRIDGPAIVVSDHETTLVFPGYDGTVDPSGALVIEKH